MLFPGFILSLFCKLRFKLRSPVARMLPCALVHLALIPPAGAGLRLLGIRILPDCTFADAQSDSPTGKSHYIVLY